MASCRAGLSCSPTRRVTRGLPSPVFPGLTLVVHNVIDLDILDLKLPIHSPPLTHFCSRLCCCVSCSRSHTSALRALPALGPPGTLLPPPRCSVSRFWGLVRGGLRSMELLLPASMPSPSRPAFLGVLTEVVMGPRAVLSSPAPPPGTHAEAIRGPRGTNPTLTRALCNLGWGDVVCASLLSSRARQCGLRCRPRVHRTSGGSRWPCAAPKDSRPKSPLHSLPRQPPALLCKLQSQLQRSGAGFRAQWNLSCPVGLMLFPPNFILKTFKPTKI